MAYAVKEIFYTLQGEGRNAGRAAACCRSAGCNLWPGREKDRAGAACTFCDTDFVEPADYMSLAFDHFLLEPLEGPDPTPTEQAVQHCLAHPPWRLTRRTHKPLGIR